MAQAPNVKNLTSEYLPAYAAGITHHFKANVTNAAQRLGAIITIPLFTDESTSLNQVPSLRPPWHLIIQLPASAANPIYITWDNNTAPVVGGPGYELNPGQWVKFEHAGTHLLRGPNARGAYPVASGSALQLIGTAATTATLFHFSE